MLLLAGLAYVMIIVGDDPHPEPSLAIDDHSTTTVVRVSGRATTAFINELVHTGENNNGKNS